MQGDIVKAAKWLGGCIVLASVILVAGFHPTVTGRVVTFTKVQPEVTSPSVAPTTYSAQAYYPPVQSFPLPTAPSN